MFAAAKALGMTVLVGYGSSEAQVFVVVGSDGWGHRPGGTPCDPATEIVIRDGDLLLRGPSLFAGYLDDADASARVWTADGLFRTGDRAIQVGDGFHYQGRSDEALRISGSLVDPIEIETFLCAQAALAAARVVGVDSDIGARIVAFVVPDAGKVVDGAALLAVCRRQLAAFKVPARIVVLEALPVHEGANATKVRLDELRRMATEALRDV
jgi:fatty-acyl-CoA synthase